MDPNTTTVALHVVLAVAVAPAVTAAAMEYIVTNNDLPER